MNNKNLINMKKIVFCLAAFLSCMGLTVNAQTITVSVPDQVLAGSTSSFSLSLTGGKADMYGSFKLHATFPEGFTTTGDFDVNQTAWKNTTGEVGLVNEAGEADMGFANSNNIVTSDVENLVVVYFAVDGKVKPGEYEITLANMTFGYNTADKDVAPDVTFKVNVVDAITVTLDENAEEAPTAASGVTALVKRSITGGNWSTICLPFAIPEEKMTAAFGEGVVVRDFTGYDYDEAAGEIKVKFSTVKSMEANHPYIIKVASDISEFTVEGVDIDPSKNLRYAVEEGKEFVGTYEIIPNLYTVGEYDAAPIFISENKFWYANSKNSKKATLLAFRAYFDFKDEADMARIGMIFDEETGIDNVTYQSDGEFYNLRGQRIETPSKGIYIKDGKKVVVK